jgi:hypothetical protein
MRRERDWSQQQAFRALYAGLRLSENSRASYVALDMGDRQPRASEREFLIAYFGAGPSDADAEPSVATVAGDTDRLIAAGDRHTEAITAALKRQTEALTALFNQLEELMNGLAWWGENVGRVAEPEAARRQAAAESRKRRRARTPGQARPGFEDDPPETTSRGDDPAVVILLPAGNHSDTPLPIDPGTVAGPEAS